LGVTSFVNHIGEMGKHQAGGYFEINLYKIAECMHETHFYGGMRNSRGDLSRYRE